MALPGWGAVATGEEKERGWALNQYLLEASLWQTSSSLTYLSPPNAHLLPHTSYLAARPPGLRLETLGFPSLSVPPEMVRPRVLPSRLISSTMVMPRNSSVDRQEDEQVSIHPGAKTGDARTGRLAFHHFMLGDHPEGTGPANGSEDTS